MSARKIMLGTLYGTGGPGTSSATVNAKMSLVPAPDAGYDAGSDGYSEQIAFENGLADVVSSAAGHRVYNMDWGVREATGAQGLDIIKNYSQKVYGPGLIYVCDEFNFTTNLLDPVLAAPGLIEQGWKNIYNTTPTFANVGANTKSQPPRSAVWSVTSTASAVPTDNRHIRVIPIHPEYTLNLGFTGSATGTAVVRVRPINLDGSYASTTDLTLLADNSTARMNATFAGSSYKAVEIYITRTSSAASTLTLNSGMAQLYKTGTSPTLPSQWSSGQGNTGFKFASTALPENYILVDSTGATRHLKGLSATLIEVGTAVKYA